MSYMLDIHENMSHNQIVETHEEEEKVLSFDEEDIKSRLSNYSRSLVGQLLANKSF